MPNHNQITLIGRLTGQPEMRFTKGGDAVCRFDIAVETGWGERKNTSFFRCVAWRKQAEYANKYLSKGKHVLVVGEHIQEKYEKDGQKKESWKVDCSQVQGLERPDTSADSSHSKNEVQDNDW